MPRIYTRMIAGLAIMLGVLSFLSGCAPQYTISDKDRGEIASSAITVEGTYSLLAINLRISVPTSKRVGSYYDGLAKVRQWDYFWGTSVMVSPSELLFFTNKHLKTLGFSIPAKPSLADLVIEADLTDIAFNYFGPILAGNYSEALVSVNWKVLDPKSEKVVLQKTSKGYGTYPGLSVKAIFEAYKASLEKLITNSELVSLMRKRKQRATSSAELEERPRSIETEACLARKLKLPKDMETILQAVLVVNSQGSLGSGFIFSPAGWALTARHVVRDSESVVVELKNGLRLNARVISTDTTADVALLKLPAGAYPCLTLAYALPQVGEPVFAVGAPLSRVLSYTVTKGIVSAYRKLNGVTVIQSDTPLNPGNSGGPLVDMSGNVLGLVSFKITSENVEGLAFAIAAKDAVSRLGIVFK